VVDSATWSTTFSIEVMGGMSECRASGCECCSLYCVCALIGIPVNSASVWLPSIIAAALAVDLVVAVADDALRAVLDFDDLVGDLVA
jgi:hypothetical protein